MKYLYVFAIIIGLSGLSALPTGTYASQQETTYPEVIISEINWAGSEKSSADEWIELFNTTSKSVDLSGWILTGTATSGNALELEEGTHVDASSTILISNYDKGHEKTTLTIAPSLVSSSLSLPNKMQDILLTTPEGIVIDSVFSEMQAGSTEPPTSMERTGRNEWEATVDSVNVESVEQRGTPGIYVMPSMLGEETTEDVEQEEEEVLEPNPETEAAHTEGVPEGEEQMEEQHNDATEELNEVDVEPNEINTTIDEHEIAEETSNGTEKPEQEVISYKKGDLRINEFVSNPNDSNEWIEIFNPGNAPIRLLDFGVMDASGKLTIFPDIQLEAGDYYLVENPAGNLNNSGDTIHLFDPSGFIIDEITYGSDPLPAPKKGESLSLIHDEWVLTASPTPGSKNREPLPEYEPESLPTVETDAITESQTNATKKQEPEVHKESTGEDKVEETHTVISIAREPVSEKEQNIEEQIQTDEDEDENEEEIKTTQQTISGTITALPGTFGKQIAFINGVQLYFYHADWPELALGDEVVVTGEPSISRGEERIKISNKNDIIRISHTGEHSEAVHISELESKTPGSLLRIEGELVEKSGEKLVIEQDGNTVTVFAHKNTNITYSEVSFGMVNITGVLRIIDGEIRIYPRSQNDIQPVPEQMVNEQPMDKNNNADDHHDDIQVTQSITPWVGGGITAATGSSFLYWFRKRKLTI